MALTHAGCGWKVFDPLHFISTPQLKLEKNAVDNFLFRTQGGKGDSYCDVEAMNDYDYEATSSLPCVILRDVVHDV